MYCATQSLESSRQGRVLILTAINDRGTGIVCGSLQYRTYLERTNFCGTSLEVLQGSNPVHPSGLFALSYPTPTSTLNILPRTSNPTIRKV